MTEAVGSLVADETSKMPTPSAGTDTPEQTAQDQPLGAIEEALIAAEQRGDEAAAEHYRQAWLWSLEPDLGQFQRALSTHLERLLRESAWSTWRDDGAIAWRLRAQVVAEEGPAAISFWIREGELGYELLVDHVDAPTPTPFARRTARLLPRSGHGLKQIERLISAMIA